MSGQRSPGLTIRVEIRGHGQGRPAVLLDGEVLSVGRGAVVCAAARKPVERGCSPADRLEAWRGSTLCLTGLVGSFARLDVQDGRAGRPRFCPYRPLPVGGVAPGRLIPTEAPVEAEEAAERVQDETSHGRPS
jgi:hypothetical protein